MSSAIAVSMLMAISLQDAITKAIAHSPELHALEAGVTEAKAMATLGDAFRSAASIATTPGYATGLPTAVLGQVPAIATVETHRLLYDASARAEQIGTASQVDATMSRLETRKREIAQSVAELYARVAADQVQVASGEKRVAAYETIATRTDALRKEGRARDLDVERASLQAANARRVALQTRNRLELDQLRLDRMVGESVEVDSGAAASQAADGLRARRSTEDPELKSLDARIAGLQNALGLQRRFFQPSVAAQAQYMRLFDRYRRYYLNFKPDDFVIGATITLPIGGNRAATAARIQAQLQQLVSQRDLRRSEVEIALREAELDLAQADAEGDLAGRARAIAAEGLRVAEELAKEGRGEANDVPLAQIALADAEGEVANTNAHRTTARARQLILGGNSTRATYNP